MRRRLVTALLLLLIVAAALAYPPQHPIEWINASSLPWTMPAGWLDAYVCTSDWVPMTLQGMVARAVTGAEIRVEAYVASWDDGHGSWPYSDYRVTVERYLFDRTGRYAPSLVVSQYGSPDHRDLTMPNLEVGRDYLLLLTTDGGPVSSEGPANRLFVAHPAGCFPLLGADEVEVWWPLSPRWTAGRPARLPLRDVVAGISAALLTEAEH